MYKKGGRSRSHGSAASGRGTKSSKKITTQGDDIGPGSTSGHDALESETKTGSEEIETGIYVYCILKNPPKRTAFGPLGFGGCDVYTIDYRDLSLVISDAPLRDYAVDDEKDVETHTRVVQEVMLDHDVLPVAYGMVFKSRKFLTVAMSAGYQAMKKACNVVDGRVEMGIKVMTPKDSIVNGRASSCTTEYKDTLRAISADWKELKLFSDRLILNAAFLVKRDQIDEFSKAVGDLNSKYSEFKSQYSGPWPAYNFVDIHILGKKRRGYR